MRCARDAKQDMKEIFTKAGKVKEEGDGEAKVLQARLVLDKEKIDPETGKVWTFSSLPTTRLTLEFNRRCAKLSARLTRARGCAGSVQGVWVRGVCGAPACACGAAEAEQLRQDGADAQRKQAADDRLRARGRAQGARAPAQAPEDGAHQGTRPSLCWLSFSVCVCVSVSCVCV